MWKITQRFRRISFVVSHVISMDTCYGLQCFCNYYIDEKNPSMSKLEQNIERFHIQSGLDLPTTNNLPPPPKTCAQPILIWAVPQLRLPSQETTGCIKLKPKANYDNMHICIYLVLVNMSLRACHRSTMLF